EHALGVHLDIAFGVIADAGDEHQAAVGDRSVEERRLLRLAAVSVVDLLDGLLALSGDCRGKRRRRHRRCRGHAAPEETTSIRWLHVGTPSFDVARSLQASVRRSAKAFALRRFVHRQNINFAPSWICRMFGYDVLVALMRPNVAVPNTALGLP